jgi:hypothetical protein
MKTNIKKLLKLNGFKKFGDFYIKKICMGYIISLHEEEESEYVCLLDSWYIDESIDDFESNDLSEIQSFIDKYKDISNVEIAEIDCQYPKNFIHYDLKDEMKQYIEHLRSNGWQNKDILSSLTNRIKL